ncbi:bacterial transcriptional activator domain-containing protein [Burkholderia lata]|uniref:TPR domain-containing protein n=1 Tax=Burkholderia lata (strain ATCC 17760 / DSM 23089 / LMG 22485 / NCIMB 9086 / R18194 / 383) TaxID=482957 RepID=A0A6P2UGG3_BURL3|nr:bacterial transcriptional activator domain-containing protein [Burkholderia lata]VWC66691.1 TPR domain-containing protein [Burkholderia lata]
MVDLEQQLHAAQTQYAGDSHDPALLHRICELLTALRREEDMLPWADRALALDPHDAVSVARRADALYLLGRYVEAADTWKRDPSRHSRPELHRLRLGMSLMMAGDLPQAIVLLDEAFRMAESGHAELTASIGFAMGEAMLKAGDPRGFAYWRMRDDVPRLSANYRPIDIPAWDGVSDVRGKRVLVTHEHGFGDNFLLAACVRDWLAAGAHVMLTCHPQSHALMQASLPHCEVVAAPNPLQFHAPLPGALQSIADAFAPDLHATLLHLPMLKAQQTHVPDPWFSPYIQVPPQKQRIAAEWAAQLRDKHPGKKLIGLFWDCVQRHWPEKGAVVRCWASRRSLPLDTINEIVEHPAMAESLHFVNLHHPAAAALAGTPASNVSRYQPVIRDFGDTAACIAQLDAVVAVDSGVANLAAMMGMRTCVPTHICGDWRWGVEGTASPWISHATALRQTREGDWSDVVRSIQAWLMHTVA